jgi:NADH-quinone oxidoreductase subunit N
LAGYYKRSIQSSEASLKYLVYGAASSAIMIYGISILYGLTGTTNIFIIQALLGTGAYSGALLIMAVVLILAGIAFKISAFPFHFWTPDVYEGAPTHFTAYLSVASKIGGFILLLRLILDLFFRKGFNSDILQPVSSLPWDDILIFISIGSMTIGNLVALWQKNIKRLLAYSSIAHAGYLLAGIAALNSTGMVAVLVYFAFYLLMNMGAFLVVILIKNEIKSEMLEDYNGIGSKMPLYAIALSIFLVSLTGLPPTAGFIGKFYILMALINADMVLLAFFLFLNSVISLYYYVRVMKHLFISKPEKDYSEAKQSVYGGVLTLVLAVPTLIFGIFFTPILKFAEAALKFYLP